MDKIVNSNQSDETELGELARYWLGREQSSKLVLLFVGPFLLALVVLISLLFLMSYYQLS